MNKFDKVYNKIVLEMNTRISKKKCIKEETEESLQDNFKVDATFFDCVSDVEDIDEAEFQERESKHYNSFKEFFDEELGGFDTFEISHLGADVSADMEHYGIENDAFDSYTYELFIEYFNACHEDDNNFSTIIAYNSENLNLGKIEFIVSY